MRKKKRNDKHWMKLKEMTNIKRKNEWNDEN